MKFSDACEKLATRGGPNAEAWRGAAREDRTAAATGWTHTHNAYRSKWAGSRRVAVCKEPHSGEFLTRSEWTKVHAGGTPDLPPDRYSEVVPV